MPFRLPSRRTSAVAAVCAVALAARLAVAPWSGYAFDIGTFKAWTAWAGTAGLADMYTSNAFPLASFPNYAIPFYLFGLLGWLWRFVHGGFAFDASAFTVLVKLPGILGDFLLAYAVFRAATLLTDRRRALLAAGMTLYHPALFYVSAVWGQLDSLYAAFLILSLDALARGRMARSWASWTAAALTKTQSIIVLPLLLLETVRRRGWRHASILVLGSAALAAAATLPFIAGRLPEIAESLLWNASRYPFLTLNAMNVWWPVSRSLGVTTSDMMLLGGVPARAIGAVLFLAAVVFILTRVPRRPTPRALFLSATCLAFAFFLFPTEVHERYLYPAIPLLILLAIRSFAGTILAITVSTAFFVNLLAVLPLPWRASPGYTAATSSWESMTLAHAVWITLFFCFFALIRLLRTEARRPIPPNA